MIHFERTFDYELIRGVLTHPKIYPHISDDNSPAAEDYYPIESEAIWYVAALDICSEPVGELLGIWMFVPANSVCWEVHTCLLPAAWGDRGHAAARMLPDWIWQNTPCRRIVTTVPADNRLAHKFAVDAGMVAWGRNKASFLRGGQLQDQICLGISRPEGMPLFGTADAVLVAHQNGR